VPLHGWLRFSGAATILDCVTNECERTYDLDIDIFQAYSVEQHCRYLHLHLCWWLCPFALSQPLHQNCSPYKISYDPAGRLSLSLSFQTWSLVSGGWFQFLRDLLISGGAPTTPQVAPAHWSSCSNQFCDPGFTNATARTTARRCYCRAVAHILTMTCSYGYITCAATLASASF
jgi:hypothetical protein